MIPTLHTDRLTLRAPRLSDFDAHAAFQASERSRFVGGPRDRRGAWNQFTSTVGQWALRGYGRWMVADRTTDEPLGLVGLHNPDGWPEPELAWSLYAAGEGRGIAHEAAVAARRHAYGTLGWTTLMSVVDPANERSRRLAERLGCRPDGTFEHATLGTLPVMRHPAPADLTEAAA